MGFFEFLTGKTVDEKKITTFIHLMWLVMNIDGEQSESENTYIRNYLSSLKLNNFHTKRILKKMESITKEEALNTAQNLTVDEKSELINKLMQIAKIDGTLDAEEAFMIMAITSAIEMDVEDVATHMIEEYGLDQAELDKKMEAFNQKKNSSENKAVNTSSDVNQMVNDFSNETYNDKYFDCNLTLFTLYKEEYSFVKHIRSKMKAGKIANQEGMDQIIKNELNQYDVGTLGGKQYMFGETTKMLGTFLNDYDSKGEKGFKGYEELEQYHSISGHITQMMPAILMEKMLSGK